MIKKVILFLIILLCFINTGSAGWFEDSAIVSGLGDVGDISTPVLVYNFSEKNNWNIIVVYSDVFNGFYYNGSQWVENSSIVSGLSFEGSVLDPSIGYNVTGNNQWNLIYGNYSGEFTGFYWSGSQWVEDSAIVSGLGDVGFGAKPDLAYNVTGDNQWNLISGDSSGEFTGFYYNGSQWVENSSIVSGLGDVGKYSAPDLVYNVTGDNQWNLISGDTILFGNGRFTGFYYNGSQWVENSSIVSGLSMSEGHATPSIGYNVTGDNQWNLISGTSSPGGYFLGFYNNNIPSIPTSYTNLGINLIDHTPTITWTEGTDADSDPVSTYVYVGTTSTPTTVEGSTAGETLDLGSTVSLTDGTTYYYRLRSYDGYEYSDYTTADEFRMNSIPSISNVTLSPIPTTDTDDLTAYNDTATDAEGDSITLYYRWYNNSTLQPALNDMVTVNQSNFTAGDIWKVGIIPNDGYENGTEVQSSTTTIGSSNIAPTLTGIQSNLTTRKYNQSVAISTLNATDNNDDNYILYIGTATGLSDLCTSASTPNGTQANCSFAIPWTSGAHTIYGRLYDGNDTSIEYQEVITVDVTPPVIGVTSVSSSSGLADFPFLISADVTVANGSVSWVYACVSKLGDTCTNYSLSNSGGSLYTGVYTDTTAAGNYYVTYYSSDDSGNIAYKSTPDSITLAPSQGQGGTGGITINETIIEIGDLTLTPPRLDTYFFLTSFDAPQTAEYTFIANRKVESCTIEPNDLTSCEIEEGYIIKARMIVNSSTESYIGKLTVVDESGYTASADIIVRIVDLGASVSIVEIPVGHGIAHALNIFFDSTDGVLTGIRVWSLAGLFAALIVAVWHAF